MQICVSVCLLVFIYVHIFVCALHFCVCASICICICLCKCQCVYMYVGVLFYFFIVRTLRGLNSVWVDEEAGEGAVLICVSSVDLPSVQLHTHLITYVQMQDHTVGGIVVILISILSNGACSYLSPTEDTHIDN